MHYCWSSCITRSLVHVSRLREALHPDEVLFIGAEQMGPNDLLSREYSSYCPQLNETPPKQGHYLIWTEATSLVDSGMCLWTSIWRKRQWESLRTHNSAESNYVRHPQKVGQYKL